MADSKMWMAAAAGVALLAAGPASATITKIDLSAYLAAVQPLITTSTTAQIASSRTFGSYAGVGGIFVTHVSTATTGLGDICTGTLTSNRTVLTAGHCLSNTNIDTGAYDPVTKIQFFLPSIGERTRALTFIGENAVVDPNFIPTEAAAGNDLAQFRLTTNAPNSGYQLYTAQDDSEIGSVFTRVGNGTTGDQTGTSAGPFDFDQRAGVNVYQYNGSDVFSDVASSVLLSEFTDGTFAHDPFAQIGGQMQPLAGLLDANGNLIEVNSSPGDSGGPEFIDGKIAGVTSFGVTAAIIDGACGPGQIDPYPTASVYSGLCTNSSIGEISGDTQVSAFLPFINNYIASVPEPANWALMITGFGLIGGVLRRQRDVYSA